MIPYLIVCPLVFLAGLVDSIAGGGGLISLPAYMIAGVPAHVALGTNKTSSSMGTTVSMIRLAKHGYLKGMLLTAACVAVAAVTGSALGAHLALMVPDSVIRHMMIVVLPVTAYYVLRRKNMESTEKLGEISKQKMAAICIGAAFFIGGYDGFYGPGTGTFLLLILTGAAHMDTRNASALTKVTNLSSNLAAMATFVLTGNVNFRLGVAAGLCSIAGNYLGAGLVVKSGQRIVRPVVLVVLGILFVKILSGN
ncbi:sulfite exporter TauE/SafE family protein [Lacrimispora sp. 210928-DFI.3.58]|uniref:sulfite exporter TauE/SafE family protein n=1 Tax=Lacrimispora sp. 210928-DFI.3.58 TaxID=2883214 RepID=UPI001D06BC3C|nr:TSUP family transporter [Lacrimispora sp. 210928-DFI.3.58]MCB7318622.1 TSUP family transporter [Lacrimispora sp. 210928-DFI.3.58]